MIEDALTLQKSTGVLGHRQELYSVVREWLLVTIFLLLWAYIHYNFYGIYSVLIQCLILAAYYVSKKNYLWIYLLMFVSFSPGGIFNPNRSLPLIIISAPVWGAVTFQMAFILVTWLKILKKPSAVFYLNRYIVIIVYFLFLLLIFGARIPTFIRTLISYSALLAIPLLLTSAGEFDKISVMVLLANLLVFTANAVQIASGSLLLSLVSPYSYSAAVDQDSLIRATDGIPFAFLSVIISMMYLSKEKSIVNPLFSYTGFFLGVLNIIFSATRGWIISSVFLILGYSFFLLPRLFRNLMIIVPILVITAGITWRIPFVRSQIVKAYNRTLYFENLTNPDFNPETTDIGRVIRGGRVMNKFRESPVLGFGFGKEAMEYMDGHAGNQTMLLNFGIIGYALFVNLWLGFIILLLSNTRILFKHNDPEYKINILVALSFLSFFLIHSTSGSFLHPMGGYMGNVICGIIFAYGNNLYYKQRKQYIATS